MATAPITDLKNRLSYYLRRVARGETVTILDRGSPIAQITPLASRHADLEALASAGLARLPLRPLPDDFWRSAAPSSGASVGEALTEDREDRF